MARRMLRHSASVLGAVTILDLSGRSAFREFRRQLPARTLTPAAARAAQRMRTDLDSQRRSLSAP